MHTINIKPNINKKTFVIEQETLPGGIKNIKNNIGDKLAEIFKNPVAAAKLKEIEKISGNTVMIGFEKAVAHFENPVSTRFPQEDGIWKPPYLTF